MFMKNAKAKLTMETAALRGWKLTERDTMPAQVATEYLCELERLTGPQRRVYTDARVTLWCAIQEPKPRVDKLARKYHEATLTQLGKWNRRAARRRRGLQYKYSEAVAMPDENPRHALVRNRLMTALDFATGLVDQVIDGTAKEISTRSRK